MRSLLPSAPEATLMMCCAGNALKLLFTFFSAKLIINSYGILVWPISLGGVDSDGRGAARLMCCVGAPRAAYKYTSTISPTHPVEVCTYVC